MGAYASLSRSADRDHPGRAHLLQAAKGQTEHANYGGYVEELPIKGPAVVVADVVALSGTIELAAINSHGLPRRLLDTPRIRSLK